MTHTLQRELQTFTQFIDVKLQLLSYFYFVKTCVNNKGGA